VVPVGARGDGDGDGDGEELNMNALEGKVAILTGAGSRRGQGAAEALMFAKEGAEAVVVADLAASAGEQVAGDLGAAGRFVALDVTSAEQWRALVTTVLAEFGRIDVLVNNAGIWLAKGVIETTPEEFRRVIEVNQTGVFLGMWAVAPAMRDAGRGSIVNISSNSGLRGGGMPHAYAASKWAVRGMSRAAAWELAPFGIRVNAVCPGVIDTPMIEGGQAVLDHLASMSPAGRVGTPEEVARLVTFLASDASSYVSGAEIAIDAAFTA
jgi:3alpha(or 20beta)-hydroxysteroid dehydrogenase